MHQKPFAGMLGTFNYCSSVALDFNEFYRYILCKLRQIALLNSIWQRNETSIDWSCFETVGYDSHSHTPSKRAQCSVSSLFEFKT